MRVLGQAFMSEDIICFQHCVGVQVVDTKNDFEEL
jgi:hypothetical protein